MLDEMDAAHAERRRGEVAGVRPDFGDVQVRQHANDVGAPVGHGAHEIGGGAVADGQRCARPLLRGAGPERDGAGEADDSQAEGNESHGAQVLHRLGPAFA